MSIKTGDRVKFISDTRCGIVKNISHSLALVDVDGFEIPVQISELIPLDEEQERKTFRLMGGEEKNEVRGHRGDKQNRPHDTAHHHHAPSYGRISIESEYEDEPLELPKRTYQKESLDQKSVSELSTPPVQQEIPYDVCDCTVKLVFVPKYRDKAPEKSDLDMYLVNDSSYNIYYCISRWSENDDYVEMIARGEMEFDSKIKISTMERKMLNEIIQLQISVLPFKEKKYIPVDGASGKLELHPLKFVKSGNYVENDYFDEPAIEFSLIDNIEKK